MIDSTNWKRIRSKATASGYIDQFDHPELLRFEAAPDQDYTTRGNAAYVTVCRSVNGEPLVKICVAKDQSHAEVWINAKYEIKKPIRNKRKVRFRRSRAKSTPAVS